MKPANPHRRRASRRAVFAVVAVGLIAVPACGSADDSNVNTPADTSFGTVAPVDNSVDGNTPAAPGDTTTAGSMTPGGSGTVTP